MFIEIFVMALECKATLFIINFKVAHFMKLIKIRMDFKN